MRPVWQLQDPDLLCLSGAPPPWPCSSPVCNHPPRLSPGAGGVERRGEGAGSPAPFPAQLPEDGQASSRKPSVCWAHAETVRLAPACLTASTTQTSTGSWAGSCYHPEPVLVPSILRNKHPRELSKLLEIQTLLSGCFFHGGCD